MSKSKGLGDTIDKITTATGIKKAVKFLFGEDCGCEERKQILNKIFPYAKCLTEEEYNYLKNWFAINSTQIDFKTRTQLIKIYNRVLNKRQQDTSCSSCLKQINNDLKRIYDKYE